ncbi:MAG TPA: LuxR C-terminal-related transcriptional regulator [Rhodocyclaceae bacterium]|nr:LuxR C-terminal-related transcriptional regulator [Rhodocyclaceae bacterium]
MVPLSAVCVPPRLSPRHIARGRLAFEAGGFANRPVVVVRAPQGFGKTTLLAQWRREALATGAAVAWLEVPADNDAATLLRALIAAVRQGCARPQSGTAVLSQLAEGSAPDQLLAHWFAELAQSSLEMLIVIDKVELLGVSARTLLRQFVDHLPSNLSLVLGARSGFDFDLSARLAYGTAITLEREALRYTLDETLLIVRTHLGEHFSADLAARWFELSEGWPLGLQMILAAQRGTPTHSEPSSGSPPERAQLPPGLLEHYVAPYQRQLLVRLAVATRINRELAIALVGVTAGAQLPALLNADGIFVREEDGWLRMHRLVREALLREFATLPWLEQHALHERASEWLEAGGQLVEAAQHAFSAGEKDRAYELVERCVHDAVKHGHVETVRHWLNLIPDEEVQRRPHLSMAAAWALALSDRNTESSGVALPWLEQAENEQALRSDAPLIAFDSAFFADQFDRAGSHIRAWCAEQPLQLRPRLQQMRANRLSLMELVQGQAVRARQIITEVPLHSDEPGFSYGSMWREFIVGSAFVQEAQYLLAERQLNAGLARADAELGRRHHVSAMIAGLYAWVCYERDKPEAAEGLLADRLDVIARLATPDALFFAFVTAARIAKLRAEPSRALEHLTRLESIAITRQLPRIQLACLAEQLRFHAAAAHLSTCEALAVRIETLHAALGDPARPIWCRHVDFIAGLARLELQLMQQRWHSARDTLATLLTTATLLGRGTLRIRLLAQRAFVADQLGETNAEQLAREALDLAAAHGVQRSLRDHSPLLTRWLDRFAVTTVKETATASQTASSPTMPTASSAAAVRVLPSMMLTPKEQSVLGYLSQGQSNKEIAQALELSEQTVKWHLKNLFGKLEAGTRRHAVRRAQMLGILAS